MRPSPSRLSERPSPVAPSFPPRSIVNAQPSATEDIGHARSVAPQPAPLPGNVPPISTHPRGADYMRGADKEIPSRFILGTEKVNQWRERQRSRLASQPSPSLPGLAIGQPPGARAFNLLYAAFLLAAPVGGLYKLAPLFVGFRNNGLKMLCVLVFILIATGMWKLGFRALGEALGRGSRRDVLWTAARRFAKKGNLSASIRYSAEALTFPWSKRISPTADRAYDIWLLASVASDVPGDLLIAAADLLFVEMWLEVRLNSDGAHSGMGMQGGVHSGEPW